MKKINRFPKSQYAASFVLLFFLTGCNALGFPILTNLKTERTDKISANQEKINNYLNEFIDFELINFKNPNSENWKREDITKKFGEPLNIKTSEQENLHNPNQTDILERLYYKHLEIGIYKLEGKDDHVMVIDLLITGADIKLKGDIKVGDSPAKVALFLGPPTEQKKEDENLIDIYCDSFTGQTCLSFYSYFSLNNKNDNKIHKIAYQAYFD